MLAKIVPLLVQAVVITLAVTCVHEYWHNIVAGIVGVKGYVDFGWLSGHFYYVGEVKPWQDAIVGCAGGLGTALFFGVLWLCAVWQGRYSQWEIDQMVIYGVVAIQQFCYGIAEGVDRWFGSAVIWSYVVGSVAAVGLILWLYGRRFMAWLERG